MKKLLLLAAAMTVAGLSQSQAQVSIGKPTADTSAMLDIASTSRGVLIPRMTQAQRPATPANGLLIYQIDGRRGFYYYDSVTVPTQWRWIADQHYVDSLVGLAGIWTLNGGNAYNTNAGSVGIGTTAPGGKLEVKSNSDIGNPGIRITETDTGDFARLTLGTSGAPNAWTIAGMNGSTPGDDRLNIYHSNAGDVVQIAGNGNVGIGDNAELGVKLGVNGAGQNAVYAHSNGAFVPTVIVTSTAASSARAIVATADGNGSTAIEANATFGRAGYFTTSAAGNPIIAVGGNSGFGTTTPQEKLDVNGGIRVGNSVGTNPGTIRFTGTDLQGYVGGAWVSLTGSAGATNYWTASGNDISNNNSGNVGIGAAASASSKLNVSSSGANTISAANSNALGNAISASATGANGVGVNATANAAANIAVKASSTNGIAGSFSTSNGAAIYADGGSTNGKGLVVVQGRTGLGVLAPTEQLDVAGGVRVGNTANTNAGTIRYNGTDLQGYVSGQWRSLIDTGEQTLAIAGNQLSISGGNSVTLPAAPTYTAGSGVAISGGNVISATDNSATNEIQSLAISGNQLSITGGNMVTLPSGGGGYWTANGNDISNNNTGKVGIGTSAPVARLHVKDSSVVFTGPGTALTTPGAPPVSGPGMRMMWYADKGAFRAGKAFLNGWDQDSIGNYSFAAGDRNVAAGRASTAMGDDNSAIGTRSTAMGGGNVVRGDWGTAMGVNNVVAGLNGVAIGNGNQTAGWEDARVFGTESAATGRYATAIGQGIVSRSSNCVTVGMYNDSVASASNFAYQSYDPLFIVGNGTADNQRSNALVVNKDGRVGIGISSPLDASLTVRRNSTTSLPQMRLMESEDDFARLEFANTGTPSTWTIAANSNATTANSRFNFYNSTSGDLMSITGDGNVGIGNTNPGAKLEVAGQIKITGGTPGLNKVLTSDANGLASWQPAPGMSYTPGLGINISGNVISATDNSNTNEIQDLTITGNVINLSNGGGSVTVPVGPTYTAGSGVAISGGNVISANDNSATNEIQSLTLTGNTLAITGGNSVTLPSGGGSGWGLTGNSGTNPTTNYIGTSDNKDVVLKRNGTEALRIYNGGALVVTGDLTTGVTPVSGAGTRMMFIPNKYAFRSGSVSGNFWDEANIGAGSFAHGYDARANGNETIAMGSLTWANGHQSIAIGQECQANYNFGTVGGTAIGFHSHADGNYSTAIGFHPGAGGQMASALGAYASASGYASAAVGFHTEAQGNYSGALGNYVSTNGHDGSFIIGDGSTVVTTMFGQNDADHQMAMRFKGGYKLFTDQYMTIGAQLGAGANAWSTTSDRRKKENLAGVDGELFLNRIAAMPLTSWNYIGQDARTLRHYGPMAQDFYAAFGKDAYGTVGNDTTINQADFDGVNLIAIQALEKRTRYLQSENGKLTQANAELQKRVLELEASAASQADLAKRLEVLEAALGKQPDVNGTTGVQPAPTVSTR